MKPRTISLVLALALLSGPAFGWPPDTTDEEIAVLPKYCFYTQGSKVPGAYESLLSKYGHGWSHMHHYCYALVNINRLNRMAVSKAGIPGAIQMAQADLLYVLGGTAYPFPWRPEIMVALARLYAREGKPDKAAKTAQALIAEWPKAPDGYTMLADVLIRSGRKDAATQVLSKADEEVTDKERLQRLKSILPNR